MSVITDHSTSTTLMDSLHNLEDYQLPFVGRDQEVEQIRGFIKRVITGDELSICWIEGEAGIGKSRLVKNIVKEYQQKDYLTFIVRIYPETPSSVVSLLAEALNSNSTAQLFLKTSIASSLPSVTSTVRKLSRLRPILLIFEDLHLLQEPESITELSKLLGSCADKSIAVLCTARPFDSLLHDILSSHILEKMRLSPLSLSHVRKILAQFNLICDRALLNKIITATRGIPFYLRALLHDVIFFTRNEGLTLEFRACLFTRLQERRKRFGNSLVMEITRSLTPKELHAASLLSALGEIFTEEEATAVLTDAQPLLTALIKKGIVSTSRTTKESLFGVTPLSNVYTFSHTLLHEELLAGTPISEDLLFQLIEKEVPLLSNVPLRLAGEASYSEISPKRILAVMQHLVIIAGTALNRSNVQSALVVLKTGTSILERHRPYLDKRIEHQVDILLKKIRLSLSFHYPPFADERRSLTEELLRLTTNYDNISIATVRLAVLRLSLFHDLRGRVGMDMMATAKESVEIVKRFPELRLQDTFLQTMGNISSYLSYTDQELTDLLNIELERTFTAAEDDPETLRTICSFFASPFSRRYTNLVELTERNELTERIYSCLQGYPEQVSMLWWILDQGGAERMSEIQRIMPQLSARYSVNNILMWHCFEIRILARLGLHINEVKTKYTNLYNTYVHFHSGFDTTTVDTDFLNMFVFFIEQTGLDINELIFFNDFIHDIHPNYQITLGNVLFEHAILTQDYQELEKALKVFSTSGLDNTWYVLGTYVIGLPETTLQEAVVSARSLLTPKPLRARMARYPWLLDALFKMCKDSSLANALTEEMREGINNSLQWSLEHDMAGLMQPLLKCARSYLPEQELTGWEKDYLDLQDRLSRILQWDVSEHNHVDDNIYLSMIGDITITKPGAKPKRISGARARRLLGLMVANQLMELSLSPRKFRELAFENLPSEKSIKYLGTANSRLRKMLGSNTIIADGKSAQRLNTNRVRVDLLDVDASIRKAKDALRSSHPHKAQRAVMEALNSLSGTPWPTLYDDFFEAARHDFENRLRSTVMQVAKLWHSEGDFHASVELLYKALDLLAGDDELTQELRTSLQHLGRETEAIITK